MSRYLETALAWHDAGACVIRAGHGKKPVGAWSNYQTQRPTREQIITWFNDPATLGLGIVCGAVSGNMEMLEIEGRAIREHASSALEEAAEQLGLTQLFSKLMAGYIEITPSGGVHFLYRISDHEVPGNTKLAQNRNREVLSETRGTGGWTVIAPTVGIHDSGKAWITTKTVHDLQTFTWEERNNLHALFRTLDELPDETDHRPTITGTNTPTSGDRPGDEYAQATTWETILEPHGWTRVYERNGVTHWRRPGKTEGTSATTGYGETGNLHIFTTSTIFDLGSYSKFAAYAILNHAGDFSAASRQLRMDGYGLEISALTSFEPAPIYKDNPTADTEAPAETDSPTEADSPQPDHAARLLERHIQNEILIGRARREAKRELDAQDAAKTYTQPDYIPTLTDELALPDEEIAWAITDLLPHGGNALLTAAYKSGKTTMINHLIKCLADGHKFLDKFTIPEHPRRIVVFNYEVGAGQYRRWLKDVAIANTEKITLVHLRGQRLPLTAKPVEDLIVKTLHELNAHTWVVDPFARAFTGSGDENSNSDVGIFLDTLDIIKERAGVANLILATHTGRAIEHGIERARGATRIDDWADVRWTLVKDDEGNRFFSADGRDVSIEEERVAFDEKTRSLKMGGHDRKGHKKATAQEAVRDYIADHPDCTFTQMETDPTLDLSEHALRNAVKGLVARKAIMVLEGPGRSKLHRLTSYLKPINTAQIVAQNNGTEGP